MIFPKLKGQSQATPFFFFSADDSAKLPTSNPKISTPKMVLPGGDELTKNKIKVASSYNERSA